MSPFQLVFEASKCPSASTETSVRSKKTSVRSKKKKKQKPFEDKGSKEDEEKAPAARRRKVPKSQSKILLLHEDKLPLWLSYIDKPIKQQSLKKHNRSAEAFRRQRFEGGRREGASSKEEESSKEPV